MRRTLLLLAFASVFAVGLLTAGAFGDVGTGGDSTSTDTTAVTDTTATTDTTPTETTTDTTPPVTYSPTIMSDQADYSPGSLVTITGSGWPANDLLNVFTNDNVGQTWSDTGYPQTDANGDFVYTFTLPNWFIAQYTTVASDTGGLSAATSFTDKANCSALSAAQVNTTTAHVGDSITVTTILTSPDGGSSCNAGAAVDGVTVHLDVQTGGTGPFHDSGITATTDSGGVATFSYTVSSATTYAFEGEVRTNDTSFAGATSPPSDPVTVLPALLSQTITVTTHAPGSATYGDQFTVAATASSGLPVSYSSSGVCTNSGATFTMTAGTGTCTVMYDQAGNGNYSAAPQVTESVTAEKASLTVTADDKTITFGDPTPTFTIQYATFVSPDTAASLGGTLAFTFEGTGSTTYGPSSTPPTDAGTYSITPSGYTSDDYSFDYVAGTFTIDKADQTISVSTHAPGSATYGDQFTVAATGGGSGNPIVYSSSGVCTNSGATFTMTAGTGTCTVKYDQAGNGNYNAAPQVTESVTAEEASLTVTADDKTITFGDATPAFTVQYSGFVLPDDEGSLGGTLAFTFEGTGGTTYGPSSTPPTDAGTYSVTPSGYTSDDYSFDYAAGTFTINQAPQTITVTTHAPNTAHYGDQFTVAATASSGLPVSYSSAGGCTNSGATFTMTSGTTACTVKYDQAGNGNWLAAPQVTESVTAEKASLTVTADDKTITFGDATPAFTVQYSGFVLSDDEGSLGGTLAFSFASTGLTPPYGPSATPPTDAGTYSVTPSGYTSDDYSFDYVAGTFTIDQAPQTITVTTHAPSSATYGDQFTVAATASSGLPVSYSSAGVCTNSGATFTMTAGTGTCSVKYDQAGNRNWLAANQVTESVTAEKASLKVTADAKTITFGDPTPAFTVEYSGFVSPDTAASLGGMLAFTFEGTGSTTYGPSSTPPTGAGTYSITPSGYTSDDYNFDYVAGTFTINKATTTTTLTVTPTSIQYSDKVSLSASITPTSVGGDSPTGSVKFLKSTDGGATFPDDLGSVPISSGSASMTTQILDAAGTDVKFEAVFTSTNSNFADSTSDPKPLTVTKEDAEVLFDSSNPAAEQVDAGQSYATGLTLTVNLKEKLPDNAHGGTAAAGDIKKAGLSVALNPIAGGPEIPLSCTAGTVSGSGYSAVEPFSCTTTDPIPLGTYEADALVTGNYYTGTGSDAFTVYDPSLGFATGGGTFVLGGDRVNFGFVMKYNKKGTNLQGSWVAVRHYADGTIAREKSNSLGGLAITSGGGCGVATFSGKATYMIWDPTANSGDGDYVTTGNNTFAVYAKDCNEPGNGFDSIWIGGPDQLNMTGNGTNAATLTGGNIVVPHNTK